MAKKEKKTYYTFRARKDGGYEALKMPQGDDALGMTPQVYRLSENAGHCDCPAHVACRHQTMLRIFKQANRVGTGWMFCWETNEWIEPEVVDKKGGLYEDLFADEDAQPHQPHLIDI